MAEEKYPINIWINEDRYAKLQKAGLAELAGRDAGRAESAQGLCQ